MKLLSDILYKAGIIEVSGPTHVAINSVASDSRKAERMSVFVAVRGVTSDGHNFIDKALTNGASAIVCEEFPAIMNEGISYIKVSNSAAALGIISSNFYDNPSQKLKLIGVTGTNGKTTTVTLLHNLFTSLGHKCGLLSTVVNKIDREEIASTHTTPDAISLNQLLAEMVEKGCAYCFMEVSSHAVVQHRITGLTFAGACFTNITHDHLDYHGTFENYLKAKKGFFDQLNEQAFAIVNKDDRNYGVMLQNSKAKGFTIAIKQDADYQARVIENHFTGLQLMINNREVWTRLIGSFNAYNLLMVYAVARCLKQDETSLLTALSLLKPVEGRFQFIRSDEGVTGIVDYAHTPDALENVLKTIEDIRGENESVITVVGCGGDRDAAKRPLMAAIACKYSNKVILTSDNPRSENPGDILKQMIKGVDHHSLKKTLVIEDRREAIKTACILAAKGDIILIAGKGHEKYQEIAGVKFPFDDMQELSSQFQSI